MRWGQRNSEVKGWEDREERDILDHALHLGCILKPHFLPSLH